MSKLKLGVIGAGYWGPNLVRNFYELASTEVRAVVDLSADRLRDMQTRFPELRCTTSDYTDLFQLDLDAVVVATPPSTHYDIARECLLNGLHVLVEKPIALTSAHAHELIEIARERGLVLMTGHTFVFNPAVHLLKNLIESGKLGDVYYIDAVRVNLGLFQPGLDVMWDLAPHDISILLYLLGENPVRVTANGGDCIFNGINDIAYVHLEFPGGTLAHIRVSWLDPQKTRRITVVGSQKMVIYDDVSLEKIKIYDKGVTRPPYTSTFGEFQLDYRYGDIVVPNLPSTEPLRSECEHFVECIRSGQQSISDGQAGLNVVKVLEAADESLRLHREQAIYTH